MRTFYISFFYLLSLFISTNAQLMTLDVTSEESCTNNNLCWCHSADTLNNQGFCVLSALSCSTAAYMTPNLYCGDTPLNRTVVTNFNELNVAHDSASCERAGLCWCNSVSQKNLGASCVPNETMCRQSASGVLDLSCTVPRLTCDTQKTCCCRYYSWWNFKSNLACFNSYYCGFINGACGSCDIY